MATLEQASSRPIAEFPPEIWENSFTLTPAFDDSVYDSYAKRIDTLKGEVRQKLDGSTYDVIDSIKFIDALCRLGLSHHFKAEIEDKLNGIFRDHSLNSITTILDGYDLCTMALVFQALRLFGHKLPSDVFKKFKNKDGKFDETLSGDARAMLSLYEAAQWATHGEEILDEALEFSKAHLVSLATQTSPHLAKRIESSLIRPYHKGTPRVEARQYIEYYEKEDDIRDDTLLEFAMLDFNFCQLMYRQELKNIMRWFKDSNLEKALPYGRARPVAIFFWSIGICYEPQYSMARGMFTKNTILISYIDDTYDAYGTIDELNLFTDAIKMYPKSKIKLPDYMKPLHEAIRNFYVETERELAKEGRSPCVSYAIDALKALTTSYLQECMWLKRGYIPRVEEYMENGMISSAYPAVMAAVLMGMVEANLNVFEWFSQQPLISRALGTIGRVMNDIVSHGVEQQRKHPPSVVECYMKQYGVSEKDAIGEIKKWIVEVWKDTNEDLLKPNSVSNDILIRFFNNSRTTDVFYAYDDGYTISKNMKNDITSVLFEEISIGEV